MTRLAEAFL